MEGEELFTTRGHPFWVAGIGWRMAKELRDAAVLHAVTGSVPLAAAEPAGEVDHAALFRVNREATAKAIRKAMRHEPTIDWLLENQDSVTHYFHQLGLDGQL